MGGGGESEVFVSGADDPGLAGPGFAIAPGRTGGIPGAVGWVCGGGAERGCVRVRRAGAVVWVPVVAHVAAPGGACAGWGSDIGTRL